MLSAAHCDGRLPIVVRDHALDKSVHLVESLVAQRHQAVFAAFQGGCGKKIRHQGLAEHQTAGANDCDLCHGGTLLS
jgi:hypothetical protein